jgi:hypothetical protein
MRAVLVVRRIVLRPQKNGFTPASILITEAHV